MSFADLFLVEVLGMIILFWGGRNFRSIYILIVIVLRCFEFVSLCNVMFVQLK